MSKFKVKKIASAKKYIKNHNKKQHLDTKNAYENSETRSIVLKKRMRKVVFFLLFTILGVFGISSAINGISQMRIGTGPTFWFSGTVFRDSLGNLIPTKKWVTNILVVGIGWWLHQWGTLADSIMLASLDADKDTVTMISIPRDLYVAYPKRGAGKINALYSMGIINKVGVSWLANKVSEITWQSINYYAVIDFSGFKYIVNALGGVEVDVEKNIYDNKYPTNNYGYTVFSLKKWVQNLDGATALKYARSRHSTSDMDRSRRQQKLIAAIKSKAFSLNIITNPQKINELIQATNKNISTNLTVGDIVKLGTQFGNIDKKNIRSYNINADCYVYTKCSVGGYLYQPSMAYFGGSWAIIPQWALMNRLSFYQNIQRFVNFILEFPSIYTSEQPIVMITTRKQYTHGKNILKELKKIGINFKSNNVLKRSTGSIEQSHINVYWNKEHSVGINPESDIVKALATLEKNIPIHFVTRNEYVNDDGPKIEIVLWDDAQKYFDFARPLRYLPKIESPKVVSGEKNNTNLPKKSSNTSVKKNNNSHSKKVTPPTKKQSSQYKFDPGEIESFD